MKHSHIFFILFSYFLILPKAISCTSFCLESGEVLLVSKSYDWNLNHGHIIANKRNLKKTSLKLKPEDNAFTWVSKYGSLTFNQYGREFPLGGMNEKGLTVEILWLKNSVYPAPGDRKTVNELQWIQYQLDNSKNVSEAITNAKNIVVSPVTAKTHYFICDKLRKCASFEYLKGELVIHSSANTSRFMPIKTITNHTYKDSLNFSKDYKGFGGNKEIPSSYGSLDRFVRASYLAQSEQLTNSNKIDYAMAILDSVAGGTYSVWNIVYDLNESKVYYRTRFGNKKIRSIDFKKFNYSCKTKTKFLPIINSFTGAVTAKFKPNEKQHNKKMVEKSLKGYPKEIKERVSNYPYTLACTE